MSDEPTTHHTPEDLDTLERQLGAADPAEAPSIAEDLANFLGDALEATQEGRSVSSEERHDEGTGR